MVEVFDSRAAFEAEVEGRFGLLPNFFRSSLAAPELIEDLWGFAKAAYLDSPIPSLFKERLFVWLSRFCPARYCIVRHVGFLLGLGRSSGDAYARAQTRDEIIALLKRPTPWARDMPAVYARLEELPQSQDNWPNSGTEVEDLMFACAALVFTEPAFSEPARGALLRVVGARPGAFVWLSCFHSGGPLLDHAPSGDRNRGACQRSASATRGTRAALA